MDEQVMRAYIDAVQRQIDATIDNTKALQKIEAEIRIQTNAVQSQERSIEEMKKHFTNGFKTEILKKIADGEDALDKKMSEIDKDMKVQWAILGGGFFSVVVAIVIAAFQIAKG